MRFHNLHLFTFTKCIRRRHFIQRERHFIQKEEKRLVVSDFVRTFAEEEDTAFKSLNEIRFKGWTDENCDYFNNTEEVNQSILDNPQCLVW